MSFLSTASLAVSTSTLLTPTAVLAGFLSFFPILYLLNFYAHYKRHQAATPWTARDKVVVITGASSGIGEALAYEFAKQGAILFLCARRPEKLAEVATTCKEKYGAENVVIHKADVTRESDIMRLIETIDATHEKIDCLVLNAGVAMGGALDSFDDFNIIKKVMDVNFFGSTMLTYHALPLLKKAEKSRIVVVSSIFGFVPSVPFRTGYIASKCALKGFYESLQSELINDNVFISIAYPGLVKTEIGKNRLGTDQKDLDFSKAMSSDACAKIIVDGTIKGQKEIIPTHFGMISKLIDGVFPDLLTFVAHKRAKKLLDRNKVE